MKHKDLFSFDVLREWLPCGNQKCEFDEMCKMGSGAHSIDAVCPKRHVEIDMDNKDVVVICEGLPTK